MTAMSTDGYKFLDTALPQTQTNITCTFSSLPSPITSNAKTHFNNQASHTFKAIYSSNSRFPDTIRPRTMVHTPVTAAAGAGLGHHA